MVSDAIWGQITGLAALSLTVERSALPTHAGGNTTTVRKLKAHFDFRVIRYRRRVNDVIRYIGRLVYVARIFSLKRKGY